MSYPSNSPWLDCSNYIQWRVQVMKILITQFSQTLCHFIPLRVKIFSSALRSQTPQSLNVTDQVSHSYRIIVFCIPTSTFLDSRRENESFWTEW
jgi:hypothetical protein